MFTLIEKGDIVLCPKSISYGWNQSSTFSIKQKVTKTTPKYFYVGDAMFSKVDGVKRGDSWCKCTTYTEECDRQGDYDLALKILRTHKDNDRLIVSLNKVNTVTCQYGRMLPLDKELCDTVTEINDSLQVLLDKLC